MWAWWKCRNHMGDRWREGKGASVKVYSGLWESFLVRWSHTRPVLTYVAPAHGPGVLSRRRRKGFMERRNGNLGKPVLLFWHSSICVPTRSWKNNQTRDASHVSHIRHLWKCVCVQVLAEKAPVVTWDRLAWLPTGVNIEMEDVEWNRREKRMSGLWEKKAFISVAPWIKNRIETIQQFMQYSVAKSSWVRNHNFRDV